MKQRHRCRRVRAWAWGWGCIALALVQGLGGALDVPVARPVRSEIHRFVTLPGTLRANQQATLYAKVAGYLKTLSVDRGDRVTAGQVLGEIEVPELLADLTRSRAELAVAETDFRRVEEAQKKAPDLVVPQTVDEARGRLEIARANLERIETLLRYARLTAPFAGVVTARFLDPGAFVPAATSGSASPTAAVVIVMDFSTVRAQVPVPELEAAHIRVGQPVQVRTESLTGRVFSGSVSRHGYALEEATRTMLVEADLPNSDLTLRPGMYVTVKLGVERHANALLVPAEAVLTEKSGTSVFKLVDSKAKKCSVKTGFNDGVSVEILTGVEENDPVLRVGKLPVTDGLAVNPVEGK